jgi:hypothetical protein
MERIVTGIDNDKFVQLCVKSQIDFLLIGGAAVLHHGCRHADDGAAEIDLLVETSSANAERLMRVIKQVLGGVGLTPEFTEKELQLPNKQLQLKSLRHNYNLDILTAQKEWSYSDLQSRSELGMLCSTKVRVVSKADLIWLKEWTVKHLESEGAKLQKDFEKHRNDLLCLKNG